MKFIGQYIQQFIARFRSDVYLESLSNTSETGVLVVDSAGKISKNAGISGGVASTVTVTNDTSFTDFPIVFHNESNGLLDSQNFKYQPGTGAISTTGSFISTLGIVQGLGLIAGASGISSTSTNASAPGPVLNLTKNRNGASAVNNDEAGEIQFNGVNDAGTPENITYAQILSSSALVTDGDERGKLELKVANDGVLRNGITFLGTDTAQEVDVTIGNGAASITTVAGTLTMGGTATLNNNGVLQVAAQTSITSLGTLTALDVDDVNINGSRITLEGSAHDQCVIDCTTHGATTITTTDDSAAQANLGLVADGDINFTGNVISANTDIFAVVSTNASRPFLQIHNSANDATGGTLDLFNKRGGAGVNGDVLGNIIFTGPNNDGSDNITYGSIIGSIAESNDSDERGKLDLQVANDGVLRNGIALIGTDTAEEVDVNIANGAASLTTIAGNLTITGGRITNAITFDSGLSGTLTGSSTSCTGQAATVATIAGLAPNTATTAAAQPNITSLGTLTELNVDDINLDLKRITIVGDTDDTFTITSATHGETTIQTTDTAGASANLNLDVDGAITATSTSFTATTDAFNIVSATANKPVVSIVSTNTNNKPPTLVFQKTDTGAALDSTGMIQFKGDDDAGSESIYAQISSQIVSAANNSEAGKLDFQVATSTGSGGGTKPGLLLTGSATANDVDVTIGAETTSLTTIAGDLQINGNDIKDSGGNTIMSSNGSGEVTFGGANIFLDGSNANLKFDSGSDIILCNDVNGGDGTSIIGYRDSGGTARIMFGAFATDTVVICNRAANGTVQIRANGSSAGDGDEVTVVTVEDDKVTISQDLELSSSLIAPKRKFTITGNTDGTHDGDVVFIGGTTGMITGRIYHYNSSGNWELANPNAAATSDGLLGIALGSASDTNGVLLRGMVTLDHDPGAVGDVLFLNKDEVDDTGGTARYGAATATSPNGNGDIVRIIGYCLDASNGQIWFNPDNTFVEYAVGG